MRYWRPALLLTLSLALAALYLYGRPYILYNDGDPLAYFRKAWWLIGATGGADVPSRGPGYPLLLLLTGTASFDTWWGLVAFQVGMTVLTPVLVYLTVVSFSRNAALVAALAFTAFGIAYQHMAWVMVEEFFLFVELVAFVLVARYLTCRAGSLITITLVFALLALIKPAGAPFFWIFVACTLLFHVDRPRALLKPVLIYVAIMTLYTAHQYYRSDAWFGTLYVPQTQAQRQFTRAFCAGYPIVQDRPECAPVEFGQFMSTRGDDDLYKIARAHNEGLAIGFASYVIQHPTTLLMGPRNSYVGLLFLMKYYRYKEFLLRGQHGVRDLFMGDLRSDLVNPATGPASKTFVASVLWFATHYPQYVGMGPTAIEDFGGPEGLAMFVATNPVFREKYSGPAMGYLLQWLTMMYGEDGAGRLMMEVAEEITVSSPAGVQFLFGDFLAATVFSGNNAFSLPGLRTPAQTFASIRAEAEQRLVDTIDSGQKTSLPAVLAFHVGKHPQRSQGQQNVNTTLEVQYDFFKWLKPLGLLGVLLFALPLIASERFGPFACFLVATYFVSAAAWTVVMIMPGSDPRHEEVYAFIPILLIAMGAAWIYEKRRT